jgi:hypothetical protein
MVRMPLVIGADDYSGRFSWHINRCQQEKPIYFPNTEACLCFIGSDLAGKALLSIAKSNLLLGPVNCAAPGNIQLSELMKLVEILRSANF